MLCLHKGTVKKTWFKNRKTFSVGNEKSLKTQLDADG